MARSKKRGEGAGELPAPSPKTPQTAHTHRQEQSNRQASSSRSRPKQEQHAPQSEPEQRTAPLLGEEEDEKQIQLVHKRLLTKNLENQEALARQRREHGPDLLRRTMDRGDRVESALGPVDPATGQRGAFDSAQLAKNLIGEINGLIEFALEHGQVPTRIQLLREHVQALEDIRSLIRVELRSIIQPILQAELRTILQEEVLPLLQTMSIPTEQRKTAEPSTPQGLLTDVAPEAADMLNSLFEEE